MERKDVDEWISKMRVSKELGVIDQVELKTCETWACKAKKIIREFEEKTK